MERGAHGNLAMLCNSCISGGGEVKLDKHDKFIFKVIAVTSVAMGVIGFFAHGMIAKALA